MPLQWHNGRGDITQSHDVWWNDKHAGADIAEQLHHCLRRGRNSTHKHSNLGFRTDSFREMFFLEAGLKIPVEGEEREKGREGEEETGILMYKVRKVSALSAGGRC